MDMKDPANNNSERRLGGRPPMKNGFTSDLERKVRERIGMKSAHKSPFRVVAAIMSVVILLRYGWWFRGDLEAVIEPREPQDQLTALFNNPYGDKDINLKVQIIPYGALMVK